MITDDDDPIVEEIPVFLSKNMQEEGLYILQFPTKIRGGALDKATLRNGFVKPLNQELKFEVDMNTASENYNRVNAERLANAAGAIGKGRPKTERPLRGPDVLTTQAYTSARTLNGASQYLIGVYDDKEVHLTPITNILQMRPSFPHFDKEDKRTKAEQKKNSTLDDEKEAEMQQVTVKFARASSSKQKSKDRTDLANFLKQRNEEPWRPTKWYTRYSPAAEIDRQKLYANTQEQNSVFSMDTNKYVRTLLPTHEKPNDIDSLLPPRVISKRHLKEMSLIEKLKVLLKNAKMMRMDEILAYLRESFDPDISYDKVLRSLSEVAVILHGNLVPQSEIVYPKGTISSLGGVKSEHMARARDYVIFKFSRQPYLYRPDVITNTKLPPNEATEVLSSVARVNAEKKWELLLPPDSKFEQKHADLVSRQELIWRTTESQYSDGESKPTVKRVRKRSIRETPKKPATTTKLEILSQEFLNFETANALSSPMYTKSNVAQKQD